MLHDCPYSLPSFVIFPLNPLYAFHMAFLKFYLSCSLLILLNDTFKNYHVKHCIKVYATTAITSLIPQQRSPMKWWHPLQLNPPPVKKNWPKKLRKGKVYKSREFAIRYDFNLASSYDQNRKCYYFVWCYSI